MIREYGVNHVRKLCAVSGAVCVIGSVLPVGAEKGLTDNGRRVVTERQWVRCQQVIVRSMLHVCRMQSCYCCSVLQIVEMCCGSRSFLAWVDVGSQVCSLQSIAFCSLCVVVTMVSVAPQLTFLAEHQFNIDPDKHGDNGCSACQIFNSELGVSYVVAPDSVEALVRDSNSNAMIGRRFG